MSGESGPAFPPHCPESWQLVSSPYDTLSMRRCRVLASTRGTRLASVTPTRSVLQKGVPISFRLGVAFLLAVVLVGCGRGVGVNVTRLSATYPSLPPETEVPVSSVAVPQCPFEEIRLVTVRGRKKGEGLLEVMKAEARRLGGHALVGLEADPRTEVSSEGLTATVIRFPDANCRHDSRNSPLAL